MEHKCSEIDEKGVHIIHNHGFIHIHGLFTRPHGSIFGGY
jgi:hypothetical protein